MGIKHTYTATGVNDGAKQVSVDRWNENHTIDSELVLPNVQPTAPQADTLSIYAQNIGGRMMLSQVGPSCLDTAIQPNLGGNKIALWMPPGGSTTAPSVFGMNALTTLGTATQRAIATTNLLTRMTRLGFVSAAPGGSLAGARESVAKYTLGAGGGLGVKYFTSGGFKNKYKREPDSFKKEIVKIFELKKDAYVFEQTEIKKNFSNALCTNKYYDSKTICNNGSNLNSTLFFDQEFINKTSSEKRKHIRKQKKIEKKNKKHQIYKKKKCLQYFDDSLNAIVYVAPTPNWLK